MADTIREQIIDNIKTTLEGITIANGYVNTIQSVQRWEKSGNTLVNMPCIIITPGPEEKRDLPGLIKECELTVYIDTYIIHDKVANPESTDEMLNTLIGDIEKALMVDYQRNGKAAMTKITRNEMFETIEGEPYAGIIFDIIILYKHKATDPSSQ